MVTEAATRSRADVATHSRRAFTSGAQFGKSFQGGGANVWRSLSSTLLTLATVGVRRVRDRAWLLAVCLRVSTYALRAAAREVTLNHG